LFRRHIQAFDPVSILLHISPVLIGWPGFVIHRCSSRKDDETLLAQFILRVEVQRDLWILLNMFYFVCLSLAVDKEGFIFLNEPYRPRLGGAVCINSYQQMKYSFWIFFFAARPNLDLKSIMR
jgi:hypothetical protein